VGSAGDMSFLSGSVRQQLTGSRVRSDYEEDTWRFEQSRRESSPFEEAVEGLDQYRLQVVRDDTASAGDMSSPGQEDVRELHRDLFSTELLRKQGEARETIRAHLSREAEMRVRLCKLANADLFTVRFIEEARWELRERKEVIERREALDRSRLRSQLVDLFVDYLVVGGGSWSEDSGRASILCEEERGFRILHNASLYWRQQQQDGEWEDDLAEEDHARAVEAERRVARSEEVQREEHRRRFHIIAELYPAALNRLMHVMELEWVELSGHLIERYTQILAEHRIFLISDEEIQRRRIRRRCRRVLQDFILLHRLLYLQHAEEFERQVTMDNVDRMFSVLFSRETVQIKALLERTRLLNESVAAALRERTGLQTLYRDAKGVASGLYTTQGLMQQLQPDVVIDDGTSLRDVDTTQQFAERVLGVSSVRRQSAEPGAHVGRHESQSPGRMDDVIAAANALLGGAEGEPGASSARRARDKEEDGGLQTQKSSALASRRAMGKDWLGLRLGAYSQRRSSSSGPKRTLTPPASPGL